MCDEIKLMVSPLVSDDLYRAIRCIKSCYVQKNYTINYEVCVVINSLDEFFVADLANYCESQNIKYVITKSDGTPSTGKNTVFEHFNTTDFTHLTQLDGDDFFYPTYIQHVERHLKKYPRTDVLSTIPCDSLVLFPIDGHKTLKNGVNTCLWGLNYTDFREALPYGRDPIVDNISKPNYARLILFSKKASLNFRYDPQVLVGEDLKIHFDFLWAHQHDEISYWFTTASDMWIRDTNSVGVQKRASNHVVDGHYIITQNNEMFEKVKAHVMNKMQRYRTGPSEIPVDVAPMFLSYDEKIEFLNEFV